MWFMQALILHIFLITLKLLLQFREIKSHRHTFLLENKNTSQKRLTTQKGEKHAFAPSH